jgi:hypothetical protein
LKPPQLPRLEKFEMIVADVLAKVPEGSSPVFSLLPEVWASTQVIAPEKTDVLLDLLREVKLYPRNATFKFATSGTGNSGWIFPKPSVPDLFFRQFKGAGEGAEDCRAVF